MPQNRFLLFILLVLTFFVYQPGLNKQFLNWDDEIHITQNPQVISLALSNIRDIFTQTVNRTYIPLTTLSFAIEHQFFGFNSFVFAVTNVLLHAAVVALMFFLALKMGLSRGAAFFAALLFAIHPMHVESVAWLTERKDVLYSVFYLLALHQYWNYLERGKRQSYFLSILFALLSMLSKPMAYSLPLVLFIFDWLYGMRETVRGPLRPACPPRQAKAAGRGILPLTGFPHHLLNKIPFFLIVIPLGLITHLANRHVLTVNADVGRAFLTAVWTFTFYIRKFLWPENISPIYSLPEPISLSNPEYLLAAGIFAALIFCTILFRRNKWLVFAAVFYVASIILLIRFNTASVFTAVQDRFMYLPSLGVCLLFGYVADDVLESWRKNKIAFRLGVVYISLMFLSLSWAATQRVETWNNNLTFWNHVIKNNPTIDFAYYNRGKAYEKQGLVPEALSDYTKAIEINPQFTKPYNNRAILFQKQRMYTKALDDYQRLVALDPNSVLVYYNRGLLYLELKEYPEALRDFDKAVALNPNFAPAHHAKTLVPTVR
jgi:hypothetical protein